MNVKPQFQPSSALDVREVVLANKNTPVMTGAGEDIYEQLVERDQAGRTRRYRKGAFSSHVRELNHPSRKQGSGYSDDAQNNLLRGVR